MKPLRRAIVPRLGCQGAPHVEVATRHAGFGGALGHALVTPELFQRLALRLFRHVRFRDRLSQLCDLLGLAVG